MLFGHVFFLFHGSLRSPLWCGKSLTYLIALNCGLLIIYSFYDFHRYRIDFPYGAPVGGFCLFHQTRGQGSCVIVGGVTKLRDGFIVALRLELRSKH